MAKNENKKIESSCEKRVRLAKEGDPEAVDLVHRHEARRRATYDGLVKKDKDEGADQ